MFFTAKRDAGHISSLSCTDPLGNPKPDDTILLINTYSYDMRPMIVVYPGATSRNR
jgi:hypothetical protein